jgi:hypothetical protein
MLIKQRVAGEQVHGFHHTLILWIGGSRMALPYFVVPCNVRPRVLGNVKLP